MTRIEKHPVLEIPQGQKEVEFTFDGRKMTGYEGEAVSSALFANGVRQFSLHRNGKAPQGIFCANGQCSQCTVIIDGLPQKSCITPLKAGMKIETLNGVPKLAEDDRPVEHTERRNESCDVLVVGGGPSGLNATIELAQLGFSVILVDDKAKLGGKLLLQTHKFFGSEEDCFAGTRGVDIAHILEEKVRSFKNVKIYTETSVIGVFKDKKAGLFVKNKNYVTVDFKGLILSSGAREKSVLFKGNDLPGVYGAGAFQTLVNRDLVKAAKKILIIGSGNVGLIGAYHALQAGIEVAAIVEIAPKINGYKVHADKIRRMGVPIYLSTTVISAEGNGKVERVTVAQVDEKWNPILETARTYEVDTLLVAVGLSSADELFTLADQYKFNVMKTGDCDEIAEASSAMFGGKITGRKMAAALGKTDAAIDESWLKKAAVLKSRPGNTKEPEKPVITAKFQPKFSCLQEIPCNPCTTVCAKKAIKLKGETGTIMDTPYFDGECIGCGMCVAACPGLAIALAKKVDDTKAEIVLPYEFNCDFKEGDKLPLTDIDGKFIEEGTVIKTAYNKKYKTTLVTLSVSAANVADIAGIRYQSEEVTKPLPKPDFTYAPENSIVCRCERVTVKQIVDFIKENKVRDVNQLKQIRVGMGACGSKTCSVLMPMIFRMAGVDWAEVTPGRKRPLTVETPMYAIVNEEEN
ncbi:FAD-dependent oxidoreductase [bacterium]|nr:FAD-dependent oxidoreductase [bacterium]